MARAHAAHPGRGRERIPSKPSKSASCVHSIASNRRAAARMMLSAIARSSCLEICAAAIAETSSRSTSEPAASRRRHESHHSRQAAQPGAQRPRKWRSAERPGYRSVGSPEQIIGLPSIAEIFEPAARIDDVCAPFLTSRGRSFALNIGVHRGRHPAGFLDRNDRHKRDNATDIEHLKYLPWPELHSFPGSLRNDDLNLLETVRASIPPILVRCRCGGINKVADQASAA